MNPWTKNWAWESKKFSQKETKAPEQIEAYLETTFFPLDHCRQIEAQKAFSKWYAIFFKSDIYLDDRQMVDTFLYTNSKHSIRPRIIFSADSFEEHSIFLSTNAEMKHQIVPSCEKIYCTNK